MRWAYSAASSGITRKTEPVMAVMVSDLRMSRREMGMLSFLVDLPSSIVLTDFLFSPG
jgi:hypothetical protein